MNELQEIERLLKEELSDEVGTLRRQMSVLSSWQGRASRLEAESLEHYRMAKKTALESILNGDARFNQDDKNTLINAATASRERDYELCKLLGKALSQKVMLACALKRTVGGEYAGGTEIVP